jgi:competence protein ComEC
MVNRFFFFLSDWADREYFSLSSWYVVSFICGIVCAFNYKLCDYYYFIILMLFSIIITTKLLYQKNILVKFILVILAFFIFGIIITIFRQNSVTHKTIKKSQEVSIYGSIESLRPYFKGMQAIIKVKKIDPEIDVKYIKINFLNQDVEDCFIGDIIKFDALIYPLSYKVVPKGFDFFFYNYYSGIGALGKNLSRNIIIEKGPNNLFTAIQNLRKKIYNKLLYNLDKTKGNFASAILLGDGKAINSDVLFDLRYTGISHILCVSGLHLSLVMMIIFFTSRFLLNIFDYASYNFDIKKIAAFIALFGSFFYLLLSGVQIAATRAFFMTSVVLFGIILGRIPDILRTLNFSAFIILLKNPEFIFHPSFQLSFIAVLSLVSGFEYYSQKVKFIPSNSFFHRIKIYIFSNIYTSTIASIATAPLVIYHFYIFSNYSILANLIAVPITSIFIMPIALASLFFMLFGLEYYILKILGFFIGLIIDSAHYFIHLPISVWYFGFIEHSSLILYLFGFFILCFSKNKPSKFGLIIIITAFILMMTTKSPDMIFDSEKEIIGIKNENKELEIYGTKYNSFIKDYWTNWFGLKKSRFYSKNLQQENIFFITNNGKKIVVATSKYECEKSDLFINNINDILCPLAKHNFTKQELDRYKTIAIYCNKMDSICKIQF